MQVQDITYLVIGMHECHQAFIVAKVAKQMFEIFKVYVSVGQHLDITQCRLSFFMEILYGMQSGMVFQLRRYDMITSEVFYRSGNGCIPKRRLKTSLPYVWHH